MRGCVNLMMIFIILYRFFFFKQKTAYEMRISDWSSDVCSSDLRLAVTTDFGAPPWGLPGPGHEPIRHRGRRNGRPDGDGVRCWCFRAERLQRLRQWRRLERDRLFVCAELFQRCRLTKRPRLCGRTEEHTSELQSLMRISYAVFCLKKKK